MRNIDSHASSPSAAPSSAGTGANSMEACSVFLPRFLFGGAGGGVRALSSSGFLPVTRIVSKDESPDGWDASDTFDARLHKLACKLKPHWLDRAARSELVPRVGEGDPDASLLAILGMQPRAISCRMQPFMDDGFTAVVLHGLRNHLAKASHASRGAEGGSEGGDGKPKDLPASARHRRLQQLTAFP